MTDIPSSLPAQPPLEPGTLERIREAILAAYPDIDDLVQRVYYKLGIPLRNVIYLEAPNGKIVNELLKWSEAQGRTRELFGLLWSGAPYNSLMEAVGLELVGPLAPIAERYALKPPAGAAAPAEKVSRKALEKIITERSRLVDYDDFSAKLARIGKAVCRIETPGSMGTGFLVGRRHVLTNHHVVKDMIVSGAPGAGLVCRFDYRDDEDGKGPGGVAHAAAPGADWLRASSPYSQSDLSASGDPKPDELDFALIRLAAPAEDERPALAIGGPPAIVAPMDIAIIVQHPGGKPLQLAMGSVLEFPAAGLRYRYNTTTKAGSSGSPVFSADLDLIGLHHAADPHRDAKFNQAVPIWRIAEAIKRDPGLDGL